MFGQPLFDLTSHLRQGARLVLRNADTDLVTQCPSSQVSTLVKPVGTSLALLSCLLFTVGQTGVSRTVVTRPEIEHRHN